MEISRSYQVWKSLATFVVIMLFSFITNVKAQLPGSYSIKDGKMFIRLEKEFNENAIDEFLSKFDLDDLPLKQFLKNGLQDSLRKLGWKVETNTKKYCIISKPLGSIGNPDNPSDKIIFAGKHPTISELYPLNQKPVTIGLNRFRNNQAFVENGSIVTFILRGQKNARRVNLAGEFNNWSPDVLLMTKTDSGWIAKVKLDPGKHWYKFIIDGNWDIDNNNLMNEDDGRGNINSVYYKTNVAFRLRHNSYKKAFLVGSFNNWNPSGFAMNKMNWGFELAVYLAPGTYTYKFLADGNWIQDPGNKNRFPDGVHANTYNSVISIGKPHIFKLNGFTTAKEVTVAGNFNGWKKNELYMNKVAGGWELAYVLPQGNYEYRFIVDKKEMVDPANNLKTSNGKNSNSLLLVEPNYTFRLKAFPNARSVVVAGDFSNWDPKSFNMRREGNEWLLPVYLTKGKHLYKFVVDGNWIRDPANKLWEQNEHETGNSVVWIDK